VEDKSSVLYVVLGLNGIPANALQALARAVYSRKPIVILDDVFSGLDPVTEDIIFRSLFGSDGLLRRQFQTVILATHAVHLLSKADMVILLGNNGDISYQGNYSSFPTELISMNDFSNSINSAHLDKGVMIERVDPVDSEEFVPRFHSLVTEIDDAVALDIARQTGDSTVYKYYFKTMGRNHVILFTILGAICMGFTPAQSKYPKRLS